MPICRSGLRLILEIKEGCERWSPVCGYFVEDPDAFRRNEMSGEAQEVEPVCAGDQDLIYVVSRQLQAVAFVAV